MSTLPIETAAPAPPPPIASSAAGRLEQRCWHGQVPDWAGPALERLYCNLFATLPHFRQSRQLEQADTHTYAAYAGGELATLFVFGLRGGVVEVYNEVICLCAAEIEAFAHYVFAHFSEARVVSLRAVHVPPAAWSLRRQQYDYLEDIWIALPASVEAYTAGLSRNNRRNIRRHSRSLRDDAPGYSFRVAEEGAVDPAQIDAIIAFNRARMANKNQLSAIDALEAARLKQLAVASTLVGVISVGGRVCAGAISYRVGGNYFLVLMSHDPDYDRYGLGFLCCYLTICDCIERGGKEFHFLWGRYDYKRSLLGQQRGLDRLLLYRSRAALLRHAGLALRAWCAARRRRAVLWLKQARGSEHRAARVALRCYDTLRRLRWRG